ncbi:hypothetical protein [Acinetobacter sp. YH16052]|uniref:hypothetical protein n=1 Tax=Acinetobacter sp. YH16052 TaxID=2601191 RepID=UPI0015D27A27|nr:hypothetical protein [Acinetobacter sp. YH16052]
MYYPEWLIDFFQTNRIQLQRIDANDYNPDQLSVLKAFLDPISQKKRYFALPYVDKDNKVSIYVGGAVDLRELTELTSVLRSTLGTAYIANYHIFKMPCEDNLAANVLLAQFSAGLLVIELYPHKGKTSEIASVSRSDIYLNFELVNRVIRSLNHRPRLVQLSKRPVGRILRDFYLAQKEQDIKTVQQCFEEIKTNASLGAKNLVFLDIQTLAISQQWQDVLDHPKLKDIIDDLLPTQVFYYILQALTVTGGHQLLEERISPYTDVQALQTLYHPFKAIFSRLPEVKKDPQYLLQWQQWFIGAVLMGKQHYFEQLPHFVDPKWCEQVLKFVHDKVNVTEVSHEHTWHLTKPSSIEQVAAYLKHCIQLAPEYWQEYWQCLEQTPVQIRVKIEKNTQLCQIWAKIAAYCSQKMVYQWQQWFDEILVNRQINTDQMLLRLQNENELWRVSSFDEQQWLKVLNISDRKRLLLVRNAMPILVDWLMQNNVKMHEKTVSVMLSLIVEDEQHYPGDFSLAYVLSKYWQYVRVNHQYDEHMLASLIELWEKAGSALTRPRALKIVEVCKQIPNMNKSVALQKFEEMIFKS